MTHLFDRLLEAKATAPQFQTQYAVIFEDPNDLDGTAKIMHPDPNFMAAAMNGGVLPPIEAYLTDQKTIAAYEKKHGPQKRFNWRDHNPMHPYVAPRGPMSEEEAVEYLIMKDIPTSVWRDYKGNRVIMRIVLRNTIPADRTYRNAWQIWQPNEMESAA